ncbi:MAG: response regulator [Oligoflexales bacterium]|nr:response regulator [Oligoflexales bacterium]
MPGSVLAIDDSKIILIQIKKVVETLNVKCYTASDAVEGIECAKNNKDISLIIADINMPGMNGLDMCREIRMMPHHKSTKIVICTSENSLSAKKTGREIGVTAWMVKPVSESTFITLINKFILNS